MTAADYLRLLGTISSYAITAPHVREALFSTIAPALGDTVRLNGTTLLLVVAPT